MLRRDFLLRAGLAATLVPARVQAQDAPLLIRDLYKKDQSFSALATDNIGMRVTFTGFMAPPLKAQAKFFVLTKMPMAVCPFCEPEADWPLDILPVYTKRTVKVIPFNVRIKASGVLEMGEFIDEDTGFYSIIRLRDATYA